MYGYMKNYIILTLLIITLIQGFFIFSKPKMITETVIETETEYIERIITEQKKGETIYIEVEVPVEILISADVDTMSILRDFYTKRTYTDTLNVDDLGYIVVIDTIQQNKLTYRTYDAFLQEKTITNTITNTIYQAPSYTLYSGLNLSPEHINIVFTFQNKRKISYSIELPLHGGQYGIGVSVPLNFNKSWIIKR